jgi:hypothetical protein
LESSHQHDISELVKEHTEALEEKLKEQFDRLEQEKSELIAAHSGAVKKLDEEYTSALETYKNEQDQLEPIKQATLELENKLRAQEKEKEKIIQALKDGHTKEIKYLKADHDSQLGDIRSEIQVYS